MDESAPFLWLPDPERLSRDGVGLSRGTAPVYFWSLKASEMEKGKAEVKSIGSEFTSQCAEPQHSGS